MKSVSLIAMHFFAAMLLVVTLFFSGCTKSSTPKEAITSNVQMAHPARGPEKSALQIEQFSDFFCPYCIQQARILKEVATKYPEKIRMIFRHLPISGEPGVGSFPVHEASMCAAEQGKFWEFHDAVYDADKKVELKEISEAIHLNQSQFDECTKSNRYRDYVLADMAEGQKRQVSGAPTFFVNDERVAGLKSFNYFAELIDPVFADKVRAERKKAAEDLQKRINPSEAGRPSVGPEKALVTITEFSDFHCPFCIKLTETLKQVIEAYPQDVRRVWRHFPLPIHPYSPFAHLASECAHSQGQFWEFHGKIFADPGAAHSESDFLRIAESLKLDASQFKICFDAGETRKKVENDVLLGMSKKVASTPTFFVNDELFIGAKSLEDIKKIIDRKLAESKKNLV